MIVDIKNTKISKSGLSTNFNSNKQWYSIKNSLLKSMGLETVSGKKINIINYEILNSWRMIKSFEIIGDIKIPNIIGDITIESPIEMTQVINVSANKNVVKPFDIYDNEYLGDFNPFDIANKKYACSTTGTSFSVEMYGNVANVIKDTDHFYSVMQNFITRGKNIRTINKNVSSIIFVLFLELMKRGYKSVEVSMPTSIYKKLDNTLNEIKEISYIFDNLSKAFPKKEIDLFIDKITLVSNNTNRIQVVENREVLMELKIFNETNINIDPPTFISKNNLEYRSLSKHEGKINKLLKLVFYNENTKIQKLKLEQIQALETMICKNGNILAVLKTGFGKSLIYQFASVLQPRIFLNIFPINSLIKDQSNSLKSDFNLSYVIDNEELKRKSQKSLIGDVLLTKRMFLITPERLENQMMQDYFLSLSDKIGFMVFDEAHCISEWGHDFRPSYLMARYLMEHITKESNLIVIALTATAAPHIQKDIARLLSIPRMNIINIADSSGLNRPEIEYSFIKKKVNDFDRWHRSEKYVKIIDSHINNARKQYEQGIAFFIKAGNEKDLEKNKFLIKINAFSAFYRLKNKNNACLYTGKNKLLEYDEKELKPNDFTKVTATDFIIATKSFGMGVNLKRCDYVLLTEPPYSLEDLYQQSGRVGRMGQKSKVEILYHENSLKEPLGAESPYKFFLNIDDKRRSGQLSTMSMLTGLLLKWNKPITVDLSNFFGGRHYPEDTNYFKWALSHLMTEFNIVEKYFVKYSGGGFRISEITIFPKKDIEVEKVIENINIINSKFEITESLTLEEAFKKYYQFYFNKLQNDKVIGINIFREKLSEFEEGEEDSDEFISSVLNTYYKTRTDEIDTFIEKFYQLMSDNSGYDVLINLIKENIKLDGFEIMEGISRYKIDEEYINIASLLIYNFFDENVLVGIYDELIHKKYKNKYLNELKDEINFNEFVGKYRADDKWNRNKKLILAKNDEWKKIDIINMKLKILGGNNGKDI